ncbi:MAG: nucleotidyltransferase domain-containing protein [Chloroflexota bacterium]
MADQTLSIMKSAEMRSEDFLNAFQIWVANQPLIEGAALVGSHARGTAGPASDIDLVILATTPDHFIQDTDWVKTWGNTHSIAKENYGVVTSIRVFYPSGPEVEFGITSPEWAAIPVDPGTQRVVSDGIKTLYDPKQHIEKLVEIVIQCQS